MTNKEKLQFVEKVVSPFSVDQLLIIATMKKNNDPMLKPNDEKGIEDTCRRCSLENGYEEKDFQLAMKYVSEIAGNDY